MLPTELSLTSLFKHTFAFFGDFGRLRRLAAFPLLLLSLLAAAGLPSPAALIGKNAAPSSEYSLLFVFFALLLLILILTMVEAHRMVFKRDDGRYFVPRIGRTEGCYLLALLKITLISVLFSSALSLSVLTVVYWLAPQVFIPFPYLIVFFLVWTPFFMVCQFACLSAAAADEKMSFKQAFGMLKGIRLSFCSTYIFVASSPFIAIMFAGGMLTSILPFGTAFLFCQFLLFEFSLLFSCTAQAVFMSYAYMALK